MSFPSSTCVESFNVYGMHQVTFKIIPGVSFVSVPLVFVFWCFLYAVCFDLAALFLARQ